ncbi:hypothetical protein N7474_002400 [Penicillium riverlandense]|uniref:uncharacterized protein n=1 Tax=Penicillium riverlandense TaxID=1903569 RepID=UPI0025466C91|nr:uncharacterized protein N7474_002400 [Penicillium riverlandense]KAJ5825262.1 hypothetical protein N7474_002400 [Penicillium riverlandense]
MKFFSVFLLGAMATLTYVGDINHLHARCIATHRHGPALHTSNSLALIVAFSLHLSPSYSSEMGEVEILSLTAIFLGIAVLFLQFEVCPQHRYSGIEADDPKVLETSETD